MNASPPTRSKRLRLVGIGLAVVVTGSVVFFATQPAPEQDVELPRFELQALGRDGTISDADLRGKPAVVNFWASWCEPCKQEAPDLEAAWRKYKDEGVVFLGVDVKDISINAEEFIKDKGLTYPMVSDPDQELAGAMGVGVGLPQTFFVRPDGKIIPGSGLGIISAEELESQVEALLESEGQTPSPTETSP